MLEEFKNFILDIESIKEISDEAAKVVTELIELLRKTGSFIGYAVLLIIISLVIIVTVILDAIMPPFTSDKKFYNTRF